MSVDNFFKEWTIIALKIQILAVAITRFKFT